MLSKNHLKGRGKTLWKSIQKNVFSTKQAYEKYGHLGLKAYPSVTLPIGTTKLIADQEVGKEDMSKP